MEWATLNREKKLPQAIRVELKILVRERGDRDAEKTYVAIVTRPK